MNMTDNKTDNRAAGRRRRYRELLELYHGRQTARPGGAGEPGLNCNYAAAAVDKLTAYLMNGLRVRAAGADADRVRRAQELLDGCVLDNRLERLDYETEIDAAVLGDGCYRLGWDAVTGEVRLTAPDVAGIDVDYSLDGAVVERVTLEYAASSAAAAKAWGCRGGDGPVKVVEHWTAADFQINCDSTAVSGGVNPYGFIPFIVFANLSCPKSPWGVSDLDNLVTAQTELNRALGQISRILELSGNPIAVLENVEASKDIAVSPGAVWHLPEEARAYLLDLLQGGGGQLHLSYIDLLLRIIHDLAEVPRAAFGGIGRDISGVALELEMQPLLHRIWRKRLIRTGVYRRRAELMLRLYARYLGESFDGVSIEIDWAPVLPRDVAAEAATQKTLVGAGIHSRRGAMAGMGVEEPEREFDRWLEEEQRIKTE